MSAPPTGVPSSAHVGVSCPGGPFSSLNATQLSEGPPARSVQYCSTFAGGPSALGAVAVARSRPSGCIQESRRSTEQPCPIHRRFSVVRICDWLILCYSYLGPPCSLCCRNSPSPRSAHFPLWCPGLFRCLRSL